MGKNWGGGLSYADVSKECSVIISKNWGPRIEVSRPFEGSESFTFATLRHSLNIDDEETSNIPNIFTVWNASLRQEHAKHNNVILPKVEGKFS